jgi:hypothetical protein
LWNRRYPRVADPFDAFRVSSAIELPVRIYNLSEGGCFITSKHEVSVAGRPITPRIDMHQVG